MCVCVCVCVCMCVLIFYIFLFFITGCHYLLPIASNESIKTDDESHISLENRLPDVTRNVYSV